MKYLLTISLLLSSLFVIGQDLVIKEGEKTQQYVDYCLEVAKSHADDDSVYYYLHKASIIAQNINYPKGEIKACAALIRYHKDDKPLYDRLRYTLQLVRLNERYGAVKSQADALEGLASLYYNEGLYQKAAEAFRESTQLEGLDKDRMFRAHIGLVRSEIKDNKVSEALESARKLEFNKNLSIYQRVELQKEKAEIYHRLKAYPEEQNAYHNILELIKGTQYEYLQPVVWNNIGYAQKYIGNLNAAKEAFHEAIYHGQGNEQMLAAANYNLGLIYHNDGKIDSALLLLSVAEKFYQKLDLFEELGNTLNLQAMAYYNSDDQFNAQRVLDNAFVLEKKHELKKQEARSHEIQSFVHEALYEDALALESYKKYLEIKESLRSDERLKENRLYEAELIERQLRTIWSSQEIERVNQAREMAEKEAEAERAKVREQRMELENQQLKNRELRAREELQRLKLQDEQMKLQRKEDELAMIQQENRLKELALKNEQLLVREKEKENEYLANQHDLEVKERLNEEALYRSRLQLVIGLLLFFILILIVILFAYRQLRKRKKRIEEQNVIIAASKKEIEKEKEKSEGLLLNILPTAVAEELKTHGSSKPKLYDQVSVGFTDFSGFTMISEKLTPEQLVEKLDQIFLEFDKVIEKYNLQRIKTIGDAYMFASGLPEETEDHAQLIVNAAIEMRDFISRYNSTLSPQEPSWNIRIGVNTGPVVAGVIGIKKFAYDIWGDTVNTASRMESSGEVGKVNISGSTYEHIKNEFVTEYRGKIAAKNKGEIDMYFVETATGQ